MAKFYTMLTFLVVTILLFNFAGVMTSTGFLISWVLYPEAIQTTPLWLMIIAIFAGLGGIGIVIGSFIMNWASNAWQSGTALTLIPALFYVLVGDIISIIAKVAMFNRPIALLILGTLGLAWFFGIMDWWNGRG